MDRFNCLTHIYEPALFLPPENVVPSTEVEFIESCLKHEAEKVLLAQVSVDKVADMVELDHHLDNLHKQN